MEELIKLSTTYRLIEAFISLVIGVGVLAGLCVGYVLGIRSGKRNQKVFSELLEKKKASNEQQ